MPVVGGIHLTPAEAERYLKLAALSESDRDWYIAACLDPYERSTDEALKLVKLADRDEVLALIEKSPMLTVEEALAVYALDARARASFWPLWEDDENPLLFEEAFERVGGKVTASRENNKGRPRGYATWKPQAKTQAILDDVAAILDEYDEHLPLTLRQIFYRLVGAYGYDKTEAAYMRLSEKLVRARRARLIPFSAIRDDGIVTYSERFHTGPADFWDDAVGRAREYRRDRQAGQPQYVELWVEAAGMAPQLARVADEYGVPVFSPGGFASLSAVRLIANRACNRDVPTLLLNVGDCDPSGESIMGAIVEDASAFVLDDRTIGTQRVEGQRLALTAEQVEQYELSTAPAKASDSRTARWKGATCQLEALPPDKIADLVREGLDAVFDPDKLEAQESAERADRVELLKALPAGTTK